MVVGAHTDAISKLAATAPELLLQYHLPLCPLSSLAMPPRVSVWCVLLWVVVPACVVSGSVLVSAQG